MNRAEDSVRFGAERAYWLGLAIGAGRGPVEAPWGELAPGEWVADVAICAAAIAIGCPRSEARAGRCAEAFGSLLEASSPDQHARSLAFGMGARIGISMAAPAGAEGEVSLAFFHRAHRLACAFDPRSLPSANPWVLSLHAGGVPASPVKGVFSDEDGQALRAEIESLQIAMGSSPAPKRRGGSFRV